MGAHIVEQVELTLEEVCSGCVKEIKFGRRGICDKCHGQGGILEVCSECHGNGWKQLHGANIIVRRPCERCGGKGKTVREKCDPCMGTGFTPATEQTITINIPKGVETGMQMSFNGGGQPGRFGGRHGNLIIVIVVKDHELFEREIGTGNVLCDVPISYSQLVFGCDIDVPTLDGKATLKIPAGTQPGAKFRMKQKGLPILETNRYGDIYMRVKMEVPKIVSEEEKTLIDQLAKLEKPTERQEKFVRYVNR
jgi:molecular chaperone DnaJ